MMKRVAVISLLLGQSLNGQAEAPISIRADVWCPYNCEPGAKPGYMIELADAAFKAANLKIDYQNLNWARAIAETREQKFTAIVGAAKNDAEDFIFPENALGLSRSCFYTKKDSTWSYKNASSLEGITIGVIKDYTYGDEIDNYIKKHEKDSKRVDIVSGDNPLDLNIKKVKAGRIAAFIEDEAVGDYTIAQRKLTGDLKLAGCVKETPLYIAFGPKNPKSKEYAKILSDHVAKARKDGSLAKLLDSYGLKDWSK